MPLLNEERISVCEKKLIVSHEFVCWIDVMGTKNIMSSSLPKASNYLCRFHSYILKSIESLPQSDRDKIRYYQLMDGIYITSKTLTPLSKTVKGIYQYISNLFIDSELEHQFLIRGSIAYGPVVHGESISNDACEVLAMNNSYKERLLIGMPMGQCYGSEGHAPPFGIYIHESARAFGKLAGFYYSWWNKRDATHIIDLKQRILDYFIRCETHKHSLQLEKSKIDYYRELVNDYFPESNLPVG